MRNMLPRNHPLERVRRLGGTGLQYLGMPASYVDEWTPDDPYLYRAAWVSPTLLPEWRQLAFYSQAALHAELIVLALLDLIHIVAVRYLSDQDCIFEVSFRYLPQGAREILRAMGED